MVSELSDREIDGLVAERIMGWLWFTALGDSFLVPPSSYFGFNGNPAKTISIAASLY